MYTYRKVMSGSIGASAVQKGEAAELRYKYGGDVRRDLSKIVHSGDPNPHKHGYNQFADKTNSHDGKAQIVIDQAKKKRSK